MLELLLLSVGQLFVGLMIACSIGFVILFVTYFVREVLGLHKTPVETMYEFDKAELRSGGWTYYDTYFDKMEEFRSDFA